jgi:hypothetical protein
MALGLLLFFGFGVASTDSDWKELYRKDREAREAREARAKESPSLPPARSTPYSDANFEIKFRNWERDILSSTAVEEIDKQSRLSIYVRLSAD